MSGVKYLRSDCSLCFQFLLELLDAGLDDRKIH